MEEYLSCDMSETQKQLELDIIHRANQLKLEMLSMQLKAKAEERSLDPDSFWRDKDRDTPCDGATITLSQALQDGRIKWNDWLDLHAEVESQGKQEIQPSIKQKNIRFALDEGLRRYSGQRPNTMKYLQLFWERSCHFSSCVKNAPSQEAMLSRLKPLLFSSVASMISQKAAYAGSLKIQLRKEGPSENAKDNLKSLLTSVNQLQVDVGDEESKHILGVVASKLDEVLTQSSCISTDRAIELLHTCQDLLDSCTEVLLLHDLTFLPAPLAERVSADWNFPSDHLPVGAELTLDNTHIKIVTWNVLNKHYMKYIEDMDQQGLNGSMITQLHHDGSRDHEVAKLVFKMLWEQGIHLVCLQECSTDFLEILEEELKALPVTMKLTSPGSKNQECFLFKESSLTLLDFDLLSAFGEAESRKLAQLTFRLTSVEDQGKLLRVLATHLPGAPLGPARRQLAEYLKGMHFAGPTVLLGDLNFPDEAVRPLLLHIGKLPNVTFLPIPYPSNISPGSWLPKRIDAIILLCSEEEMYGEPLKPDHILPHISKFVNTLNSIGAPKIHRLCNSSSE